MPNCNRLDEAARDLRDLGPALSGLYALALGDREAPTREELQCLLSLLSDAARARITALAAALGDA